MSRLTKEAYKPLDSIFSLLTRKLIISEIVTPPKADTEHIVFAFAGQQPPNDGLRGGITGQRRRFRAGWTSKEPSKKQVLMSNFLVDLVLKSGVFPKRNSFVGLVFDAQFNYEYFYFIKQRVLHAYLKYVTSKMGPQTKTVYLAGHSRGGCLAMQMAAVLSEKFPRLRVIVSAFDPVCVIPRLLYITEFGVTSRRVVNPTNPAHTVYTTNMTSEFHNRDCLSVRSFLSGDPILNLPIHAFGHSGFTKQFDTLMTATGRPWYTQSFHEEDHDIDLYHHGPALKHVKESLVNISCECDGL